MKAMDSYQQQAQTALSAHIAELTQRLNAIRAIIKSGNATSISVTQERHLSDELNGIREELAEGWILPSTRIERPN